MPAVTHDLCRCGLEVSLDEGSRVDELVWKSREAVAARRRQGAVPRVRVVVTAEDREVEMRARAHVRDVLTPGDDRADRVAGTRPDVTVLRDHDAVWGLMADEDPAAKRRVDDVADDHSVRRRHHRLNPGLDVDAGMQPDRARGAAAPENRAVAVTPFAAESQAVRLP